jgi:hypothetical protein
MERRMSKAILTKFSAGILALALGCGAAEAQAVRTWVSGVGDDANPCSRTAPCKTFPGAISKTAAGGVIQVLDPGSFGAVTITKSISLIAEPNAGAITGASVNAIIVNAGSGDVVHIEGLAIDGLTNGLNGIRFLAGGELHVRNCVIRGFRGSPGIGIAFEPSSGNSRLYVENSTISNNTGGILVKSTGAASAIAMLNEAHVVRNTSFGIRADGANATVRLGGSAVTNNDAALSRLNGATLISYGNNIIDGNQTSATPTVVPLE